MNQVPYYGITCPPPHDKWIRRGGGTKEKYKLCHIKIRPQSYTPTPSFPGWSSFTPIIHHVVLTNICKSQWFCRDSQLHVISYAVCTKHNSVHTKERSTCYFQEYTNITTVVCALDKKKDTYSTLFTKYLSDFVSFCFLLAHSQTAFAVT